MPRTAFKQADVARLVRGAISGGMRVGTFGIQLVDGRPTLIPVDGALPASKVAVLDEEGAVDAAIQELINRNGAG